LSQRVSSSAHSEYHARIIAEKYIQRELIRIGSDIVKNAYDETTDVLDLLDNSEAMLFEVTNGNIKKNYESAQTLVEQAIRRIEEIGNREGFSGIPSGFQGIDKVTSGWQPSDLVIIAARPGMGKTSFVLSIARNAATQFGKGVALFSLEMSSLQLAQRLISMEAEISSQKLRNGGMEEYEWQQFNSAIERIGESPIYIDDTPGINVFELRAKCRRLKMQHDIQLIIIDYLQLMSGGGENHKTGNREQEVSGISRALKGLAKELNVPVIALSQLSRAVEVRGGSKRPQLSDLRESGSIEQDADIVSFIYRPEYYDILDDDNGTSLKGIAEIIVAKHRNGALKTVQLKFTDRFATFSNLDDPNFSSLMSDAMQDDPFSNIITRPSRMNDDEDIPF